MRRRPGGEAAPKIPKDRRTFLRIFSSVCAWTRASFSCYPLDSPPSHLATRASPITAPYRPMLTQ